MQKKNVGRPKKQNAIKPGQLKSNECRYTFITTKSNVEKIKSEAKVDNVSIKIYLDIVLKFYWRSKGNNEYKLTNFKRK